MKLTLTTAIATALIATGSFAQTASRGDDNVQAGEAAAATLSSDQVRGVNLNCDEPQTSRGDNNARGTEVVTGDIDPSMEMYCTDDQGNPVTVRFTSSSNTTADTNDGLNESRGAGNNAAHEKTNPETKTDG